ncbi:MAG: TlyA family RNA methyltransferase [bacterium]|nr:TlyA family RNA methyltransferase [bacterium]
MSGNKYRLDQAMVKLDLAETRSQAENYIKLGEVEVDKKKITKPGYFVSLDSKIKLLAHEHYVSRAALKLASVASTFEIDLRAKNVLDVGSSTGGFTDFALQNGAKKVVAVDVGSAQMHPKLRQNSKIELHEQTDIREFETSEKVDIIVIDVSFISLKEIMPSLKKFAKNADVYAMLKPQFEAGNTKKHKGVVKNERMRRDILKDFEQWVSKEWVIKQKSDSGVSGSKGNIERFYHLKLAKA